MVFAKLRTLWGKKCPSSDLLVLVFEAVVFDSVRRNSLESDRKVILLFFFLSLPRAVWLATQNHSTLVTETTVVPFLPVNPEYSSTRNQVGNHLNTGKLFVFDISLLCFVTEGFLHLFIWKIK